MAGFRFDSPRSVGRAFFGGGTIVFAVLGLVGDAPFLAASGACGIVWWAWDFVWDNVLGPLGGVFTGAITGTATVAEPPALTPDDTMRLLESHLASDGVPSHVQIQSALRLAEMMRTYRKDPAGAEEVLARIRAKWPDAPELRALNERGGDEVMK